MSWDILLVKFTERPASTDAIDEANMLPFGTLGQVQTAISRVFATTDWSDPTWGVFDFGSDSIEFGVGKEDPVTSIMLHVRASDAAVPLIIQMCKENGWVAIDLSTGDFLDAGEDSAAGNNAWRNYRDQIREGPTGDRSD